MENRSTPPEVYAAERLLQYRLAVSVVDNMEKTGLISVSDRRMMLDALALKYGFDKDSIYAI